MEKSGETDFKIYDLRFTIYDFFQCNMLLEIELPY